MYSTHLNLILFQTLKAVLCTLLVIVLRTTIFCIIQWPTVLRYVHLKRLEMIWQKNMHYTELLSTPISMCSQVTCSWDYCMWLNPPIRLWIEINTMPIMYGCLKPVYYDALMQHKWNVFLSGKTYVTQFENKVYTAWFDKDFAWRWGYR